MRRFYLTRREDVSGVSGTGRVAEGCTFDNGFVAMTWLTGHFTLSYYHGIEELVAIHGHEGKTVIEWVDADDASLVPVSIDNAVIKMKGWLSRVEGKATGIIGKELDVAGLKRLLSGDSKKGKR